MTRQVFGTPSEIGYVGFTDPLIQFLVNRRGGPVLKVNSTIAAIVSPFIAAYFAFQLSFKFEQSDPKTFDGLSPA